MAKKRVQYTEDSADRESRLKLRSLLATARKFLNRIHDNAVTQQSRLTRVASKSLTALWNDAHAKFLRIDQSLEIGLSRQRRDELVSVGLFGGELDAKASLLDFLFEEKRFVSALKLLASIIGSLSRVFPLASAIKEFIDAVLCVRDFLPDPEFITLGNLQ